jgi:hypothetical protein
VLLRRQIGEKEQSLKIVKMKVNFTLKQAIKDQRRSRGVDPLFL